MNNMIIEIHNDVHTFCAFGSGATTPWDMPAAWQYLNGRTGAWLRADWNSFGIHEDGLRNRAIDSIVNRHTPAVIGTGWLSHYPMAFGYAWQQRTVRHCFIACWDDTVTDRCFYVNNGWGGGGAGEWIDARHVVHGAALPVASCARGGRHSALMLAAFLAVSVLVIVTPGQDTALTIRNTLLGGRVAGVFTAVGVSAGQAVWTVATAFGVGALLVASEPAFMALKLVGSAYLVFLGVQALFGRKPLHLERSGARVTSRGALRQGLFSNLANPKMLAFFTSLLPQFASSFAGLLALGLLFCCMTLVWLSVYAVVVTKAGAVLRRARVRRAFEAVTGTVLIALGLRLATEHR